MLRRPASGAKILSKDGRLLFLYVAIILVLGLAALSSASAPVGYEKFGSAYFFVKRQALFSLLPGALLFFLALKLKYQWWPKISWAVYLATLVLLVLVFVPGVGMELNGARSWIGLGGFGFQPSELAKLALILAAAALLSGRRYDLADWRRGLLPVLAILAPLFFLILFQPDIGTLSILIMIAFAMFYLARVPGRFLLILGVLGAVAFMVMVFMAPYRLQRFTTFLHPELDPKGEGYHVNQAYLAVGSGGFWGLGFGHSRQKFQYLPEVAADSIFAVIAEENGFLAASFLIILILLIGWQGLKIAKNAPDEFGRLAAGGVAVWFVWQSLLNAGAMVGALPLTGVPLPFVSHGGSALMTALLATGAVLNISRQ